MPTARSLAARAIVDTMRSFSFRELNRRLAQDGHKPLSRYECDRLLFSMRTQTVPTETLTEAPDYDQNARDYLKPWLAKCRVSNDLQCRSTPLYRSFLAWFEAENGRIVSQKAFADLMQCAGFERKHTRYGSEYIGIDLRRD